MTWVIVVFNALMLIWLLGGLAAGSNDAGTKECLAEAETNPFLEEETCEAAQSAGLLLGAGVIVGIWAAGDVILGVLWFATARSLSRPCPVCGVDVKKGLTVCQSCGYDFRAGLATSGKRPESP